VKKVLEFLQQTFPERHQKVRFPGSSGIGLKLVSQEWTERLVRAAIEHAIADGRRSGSRQRRAEAGSRLGADPDSGCRFLLTSGAIPRHLTP